MPIDEKKLLGEQVKIKDKEIKELKELLADAEHEIKEVNDFHSLKSNKPGVSGGHFLSKLIKSLAFLIVCAIIIFIGLYPWFFKDKVIFGNKIEGEQEEAVIVPTELPDTMTDTGTAEESNGELAEEDVIQPPKKMLIIKSDLGWLNVRTEPNVETGQVIKKINSEEEYEWLEMTDDSWYKIVLDEAGHTGYVSGDYVEEK